MNKTENLKRLVNQMNSKSFFAYEVAQYYEMSEEYVLQNWFQKRWRVPENKVDKIIDMAQKELFKQTEFKRKLLLETGYPLDYRSSDN